MSAATPAASVVVGGTRSNRLLLDAYANPGVAAGWPLGDWSAVLGAARRSRTLGHLAIRRRDAPSPDRLDPRLQGHLRAAQFAVRYQNQMIRRELIELGDALRDAQAPVVLLKGAAYIAAGLPLCEGRLASDIDLLVEPTALATVERLLRSAGWQAKPLADHDERYYREWSHELPPFTHPARGIEVDVHHSITPAMRGAGVDTGALVAASVALEFHGHRRFRALQPVDQLIHCAIHTFKDSDLSLRLRETMDFDLLWRHHSARQPAQFAAALVARALELGQQRPLWWAIHFARRWLGAPIPADALATLPAPRARTVRAMDWLADRAMLPGARMERSGLDRLAAVVLLARYHYNRLPLAKLLPHLLEKSRRRLLEPKQEPDAP